MFVGQPAFLHFAWEQALILRLQVVNQWPLGVAFSIFAARYSVFFLIAWTVWRERTTRHETVRHAMHEAGWSGALALLVALGLSEVIQRNRPFLSYADIQMLVPMPLSQYSLPSAHTALSFGIAFACLWGARRSWEIFTPVALATMVGLGRVLVGVHYPTDVLAGMCVGGLAFAFVRTMHYFVRHIPKHV